MRSYILNRITQNVSLRSQIIELANDVANSLEKSVKGTFDASTGNVLWEADEEIEAYDQESLDSAFDAEMVDRFKREIPEAFH